MDNKILTIFDKKYENEIEPLLSAWGKSGYSLYKAHDKKSIHEALTSEDYVIIVIQSDDMDYVPLLPPVVKIKEIPVLVLPYIHLKNIPVISDITQVFIRCAFQEYYGTEKNIKQAGNFVIDVNQRKVFCHDKEIHLSQVEFDLLNELAHAPNRVFRYEFLYTTIWGADYLKSKYALHNVVARLRKIFRSCNAPINIENVRGVGYKYTLPNLDTDTQETMPK